MSDPKPTKLFLAQAVPKRDGPGFLGLWGAPGMVPGFVYNSDNQPQVFPTKEDAEAGARARLFEVLNKPRRMAGKKPERYLKMGAADFCVALHEAGITPTFFAYLYGTDQRRILAWMDGSQDIPHAACIMVGLFREHPETIDLAETITDSVTSKRRAS